MHIAQFKRLKIIFALHLPVHPLWVVRPLGGAPHPEAEQPHCQQEEEEEGEEAAHHDAGDGLRAQARAGDHV